MGQLCHHGRCATITIIITIIIIIIIITIIMPCLSHTLLAFPPLLPSRAYTCPLVCCFVHDTE
jgi:hypothetical protein